MADERDKYFIDLTVEQGQGLTKMEAMVKAMERLKTERKALNVAYREGLITENQLVKGLDRINVGLKGLSGRYREATNAASGLTNEGLRFRDKMAGAMTGALAKLGTQLAATFAVTRVISFFKSSIAQIENFEAAVSKLKGISRASGDEIERLTKLARELAAASKFTATQVVEAQTELAKLGLTVPQIEATTGAILQLATAADTGIANAAEIATQTMNQFNLTAAEMPRLVDIMARSCKS
jgi:methyl-accepting chemotaxis protein